MSGRIRRRLRAAAPSAALACTIYLPLLLTRPGRIGADTKTYLYLDPSRMLSRAPTMWDHNIGLGTVTHQNIGYLWPIGPFYWLADLLHIPDWVAQRIWLGSILFLAGLGVRYLLRVLGQEGPHVTAATFLYALTPYILTLAARLSVILLPYAGLPWMIGLTVVSLRRQRWREPALFALVVATVGSVNATALILAGVGPLLWILHEVAFTREVRFRDAAKAVGRIGVLTVACSLWWLAGLWAQGGYGIDILRYTETAETVATASLSIEVLRGLGYWFFYGDDRYGPWIAASGTYTTNIGVLAATFLTPLFGLLGLAAARFRERLFFALLLLSGLFLAVGAHPWDDGPPAVRGMRAFLESDVGLSMRSLPRAAPLLVLAMSVFSGALLASLAAHWPKLARPLGAAMCIFAVLSLPPLWRGQLVDKNLDRAEDIPAYWHEAAAALDARDDGTRVLEVPGSDFASYRWGNTVDPVLPGLMDRPYVARELIPYGSPASADLLNAFDHRLQEQIMDPQAVAPIARYLGVGDISVRSDLSYERYNTPRPRLLWQLLRTAPGIDEALRFGPGEPNVPRSDLPLVDEAELTAPTGLADPPEVGVLAVRRAEKIVRTAPTDQPLVVSGNGDGLVDAASAGLIDGDELALYSASFADDPTGLRRQLRRDASLLLTDTNRREARRWGTVRDNTGITERAGQDPLRVDPKDQRLDVFPEADDDAFTVTESRGGVWAEATSYGNQVSLTPEDNPVDAVDGNPNTAWRTGGFGSADDETLELTYRHPITTDHLRILQAQGGVRNRFIKGIDVSFDGGDPEHFELGEASRAEPIAGRPAGQVVRFSSRRFRTVSITITSTDPDHLLRYAGVSAVGLAEVVAVDDATGERPVADDVVRLPIDLLQTAGTSSRRLPLSILLTRQRVAGTVAVRTDPESSMARAFTLPTARTFALSGQVRLANGALGDDTIDRALGIPSAEEGGITVTSKRRMPGGLANRASAAVDGNPDTWYSPGFLDQRGEYVDAQVARPVTFDHFDLTALTDGRHSVPRKVRLFVDGTTSDDLVFPLRDVADGTEPGSRYTWHVRLPRTVSGTRIRLQIEQDATHPERTLREATTLDWFTGKALIMPVGIVELGIPGLRAPAPPTRVDATCRSDLLTLDGSPVPVSLHGTTADLIAGRPISIAACDDNEIPVERGESTLRTAPGALTGFDLDRLVLRSAAGGGADQATGTLVPGSRPSERPRVRVTGEGRTSMDLTVTGADARFWLVLGQSYNQGWHATADGKDLGTPTLVQGYANGWEVPRRADGRPIHVHLEWTPQRVVWGAIWASVLGVIVALVLALWPRKDTAPFEQEPALDLRPSMPRPLDPARILRYAGPEPGRFAWIATVITATLFGWLGIGPIPAVVLGGAAALALRFRRARPLLTVGGVALFVYGVAWMMVRQATHHYPSGFEWPTYFDGIGQVAWTAVSLLVLDVLVDRCWLRRWWPSADSPS